MLVNLRNYLSIPKNTNSKMVVLNHKLFSLFVFNHIILLYHFNFNKIVFLYIKIKFISLKNRLNIQHLLLIDNCFIYKFVYLLFVATNNGGIIYVNLKNNFVKLSFHSSFSVISFITFIKDYNSLILGDTNGHIIQFGLYNNRASLFLKAYTNKISNIIIIHKIDVILTLSSENIFKIWNLRNKECIQVIKLANDGVFPLVATKSRASIILGYKIINRIF
uniref:Uncharacterized protein n=1 Tax=Amorphochlora amoebiformis TaxID=1561963 RepID=A0A0H5BQX9_9EUKA|nr:hypothetical protein [Amorphochlora amoebiformis]